MTMHRRAATVAWAISGLLLGHQLAYVTTYRDASVLLHVLQDTGHQWLALTPVVIGLAIAILAVTTLCGAAGSSSLRRRYAALAAVQLTAYVAIEFTERVAHGSGLGDVAADLSSGSGPMLLACGIAAQLLVAAGVALLSRAVELVANHLRGNAPRREVPIEQAPAPHERTVLALGLLGLQAHGVRAPPRS